MSFRESLFTQLPMSEVTASTFLPNLSFLEEATDSPQPSRPQKKRKRKKTSWVYDHFDDLEDRYECKQCDIFYLKSSSNTTTMGNHLSNKHSLRSPKIKLRRVHKTVSGIRSLSEKEFQQSLLSWIVTSASSYQSVENPHFQVLCSGHGYKVPRRQWVSEHIVQLCDEKEEELIQQLMVIDNVALTIDCWTSKSHYHYVGITVHWIDEDFLLISKLLVPELLNCLEDGAILTTTVALIRQIPSLIQKYSLEGKIRCITTDRGSDIKKCIEEIGLEHLWFPCFNHTLNRCFVKSFDETNLPVFKKLKKIVRFVRTSHKSAAILTSTAQKRALRSFSTTRWTNILSVLSDYLKSKDHIENVLSVLKRRDLILSRAENDALKEIFLSLRCLHPVIERMQSENSAVMGETIYQYLAIKEKLEHYQKKIKEDASKCVVDTFYSAIRVRMEHTYPIQQIAVILNPNLKDLVDKESMIEAMTVIKREMEQMRPNTVQHSAPSVTSRIGVSEFDLPKSLPKLIRPLSNEQNDELTTYFSEKIIANVDVLRFWKEREHIYPRLVKIVRKFLCSQASAAAMERRWNTGGHMTPPRRRSLSSRSIRSLIFLADSMKGVVKL